MLTKTQIKPKPNNFLSPRSYYVPKIVAFVVFCSLNFILLIGFDLIYIFVRVKSFRKKKRNWFEIVLITSFTMQHISSISLRTSSVYFSKHSLSIPCYDLSISQFVHEILFPKKNHLYLYEIRLVYSTIKMFLISFPFEILLIDPFLCHFLQQFLRH